MAGRPPTYSQDDERPVSVSLRVPKALYAQAQQYATQRRLTLTELLLDGLQMRLETPTDPRELLLSDESNTVMQKLQEMVTTTVQAELAKLLSLALPLPTDAMQPTNNDILYDNGNTILREIQPGEPSVPDGLRQCKSGLHTYPTTLRECPECRRATKQAYKRRKRERQAREALTAIDIP